MDEWEVDEWEAVGQVHSRQHSRRALRPLLPTVPCAVMRIHEYFVGGPPCQPALNTSVHFEQQANGVANTAAPKALHPEPYQGALQSRLLARLGQYPLCSIH